MAIVHYIMTYFFANSLPVQNQITLNSCHTTLRLRTIAMFVTVNIKIVYRFFCTKFIHVFMHYSLELSKFRTITSKHFSVLAIKLIS